MDKVFEKTRELAMAIMESDAYRTMHEAEQAAMRNPMAASLMSDYLEAKGAVETVLQENDPDPAQLKALSEKMESCQEKLNMLDEVIARKSTSFCASSSPARWTKANAAALAVLAAAAIKARGEKRFVAKGW